MKNDTKTWTQKRTNKKIISGTLKQLPSIVWQPDHKSDKKKVVEIVCISSYPPRECGIATFSQDLQQSIEHKFDGNFKLTVCPLETNTEFHVYSNDVGYTLNTDSKLDFIKVSNRINDNPNVVLVLIQHEFGLFKNNEEAFLEFIGFLNKPVVITFHTVLPDPDKIFREKVRKISNGCAEIIVMTCASAEILVTDYDIEKDKISVIPHGTHLISNGNRNVLKKKFNLAGKTVLSTFGLLGPNKNIETTLDALPSIVEKFPEVVFLIIGKTHPSLINDFGEDYRLFLESLVQKNGLKNHVRFINQFVPTPQLLEYLQLTDIYLFTSKDPNQAVSGTFAYALSCGCPIVSTPIPHALEVLQNEAGVVFNFSDSNQLEQTVITLLNEPDILAKMSLNGLHTTASGAWENAAIAHAELFARLGEGMVQLTYKRPPISLKHLKKMTTKVGILQFCIVDNPDLGWGYTLDDNARAMLVFCRHYQLTGEPGDLEYIKGYLNFLDSCFRPDGKFLNYVDEHCYFTGQNGEVNLEDANGRAIWALGYLLSMSSKFPGKYQCINEKAEFLFYEAIAGISEMESPRAMAFAIKGLCYFALENGRERVESLLMLLADRLVELYITIAKDDWQWFEEYLTYANAVIPDALLMTSIITGKSNYREIAKSTFDFLLDKIFTKEMIRVISNKNWFRRGEPLSKEFKGGEQPIDVAYTILALDLFDTEFPDTGYGKLKSRAFEWFLGNNPLRQTIYNPCTGGCYDGIELNNVNLNQGAESSISYLLARMTFRENL